MKKSYCFGSVMLLALAVSAPAGAATWSGAYGGGNIGYGWGKADTTVMSLPDPALATGNMPTTLAPKAKGGVLGGQIGFNWQSGNTVTGVEADLSFSNMHGSAIQSPFLLNNGTPYPGNITVNQKIDWFGTLRGRIGLATTPDWLIYATGGLAFGGTKFSGIVDPRPTGTILYPASLSKTKTGWTLGAGAEWALAGNKSVKFEYLHIDLGSQSAIANPVPANPPFQEAFSWNTKADIFRVGVNFKF